MIITKVYVYYGNYPFNATVRMDPVNIPAKFEVRSFIHSWDNTGVLKKFGQSLDMPTLNFLPNF